MWSSQSTDSKERTISSSSGSSLGRMLALPGPDWCGSSFFTILGVLGGGTGMNSMEEEATQLESEVLRKILRQPKESAYGKQDHENSFRKDLHGHFACVVPSLTEIATWWKAGNQGPGIVRGHLNQSSRHPSRSPRSPSRV